MYCKYYGRNPAAGEAKASSTAKIQVADLGKEKSQQRETEREKIKREGERERARERKKERGAKATHMEM